MEVRGRYRLDPLGKVPLDAPFWCCCDVGATEEEALLEAEKVAVAVVVSVGCSDDCCLLLPLLGSIFSCI